MTRLLTPACAHSLIGLGQPFPLTLIPSSDSLNSSVSVNVKDFYIISITNKHYQ